MLAACQGCLKVQASSSEEEDTGAGGDMQPSPAVRLTPEIAHGVQPVGAELSSDPVNTPAATAPTECILDNDYVLKLPYLVHSEKGTGKQMQWHECACSTA